MRRLILLLLLRTPAAEPQTCPEIEMEQPQACPQSVAMTKPVRVLIAVRSTRRERRDAIRDTWCQAAVRVAERSNVSVAVRFWVGGGSLVEDARAGAESELFGDVAHTTHIAADDDVALAQAALRSFDLHAAAPTHWVTVTDATYVYVDRLAASLASADEKTCWRASGSAVLGRAAAVAATRGAAAPTLPTWLSACDDASRAFHAAYGENARRVDPSTVAVTGFEPGEFAFLETGAGRGIDLPRNASQVLLNLGCNLAPVLPDDANEDAVVLCFEPIPSVVRRIPEHPRLLTIPAAVSSFDGVATMHTYAKNAQSSSLGARAAEMDWNDDPARGDGDQFVVPVLSLRSVYASLAGVHVSYIKTDMQGADYAAISSLPVDVLRRTPFLLTEVWLENVQSYVGFRNDFCRDWLPFMTAAGYSLQFMRLIYREHDNDLDQTQRDAWSAPWAADPHAKCAEDLALHPTPTTGCHEADAHWIRNDTLADIAAFRGPKRPPVKEWTDWPMSWHNS